MSPADNSQAWRGREGEGCTERWKQIVRSLGCPAGVLLLSCTRCRVLVRRIVGHRIWVSLNSKGQRQGSRFGGFLINRVRRVLFALPEWDGQEVRAPS